MREKDFYHFSKELNANVLDLSRQKGIYPYRFYESSYFCSTKSMHSMTLKRHNSFQKQHNRKPTHSFAARPLILKLQQEVLEFYDICVSWCSLKTDLKSNFLNLENQRSEYVTVYQ